MVRISQGERRSVLCHTGIKGSLIVCFQVYPQAQEFVPLKQRCEEFKTFLYPIPRGGGYEFFLQQAEGSDVYFTSLSAYKAHGNEAPYCLLIRHFTELMQSHGKS